MKGGKSCEVKNRFQNTGLPLGIGSNQYEHPIGKISVEAGKCAEIG
jgi:hypothetical protein